MNDLGLTRQPHGSGAGPRSMVFGHDVRRRRRHLALDQRRTSSSPLEQFDGRPARAKAVGGRRRRSVRRRALRSSPILSASRRRRWRGVGTACGRSRAVADNGVEQGCASLSSCCATVSDRPGAPRQMAEQLSGRSRTPRRCASSIMFRSSTGGTPSLQQLRASGKGCAPGSVASHLDHHIRPLFEQELAGDLSPRGCWPSGCTCRADRPRDPMDAWAAPLLVFHRHAGIIGHALVRPVSLLNRLLFPHWGCRPGPQRSASYVRVPQIVPLGGGS